MKSEKENLSLSTLQKELKTLYVRYQLALKDGAVDSIIKEVMLRISSLEKKIKNCPRI